MINFRASLDTIDKASSDRQSTIKDRMSVTDYLTKKTEERNRYQTEQLVSGLDGIGKAMQAKNEEKRAQESHDLSMEANKLNNKFNKDTFDAKVGQIKANLKSTNLANEEQVNKMATQKKVAATTEKVEEASREAMLQGKVAGKHYPKEYESDPIKAAAYVAGTNAEKARMLAEDKERALIAGTKAQTAGIIETTASNKVKSGLEAIAKAQEIEGSAGTSVAALKEYVDNPALVNAPTSKNPAAKEAEARQQKGLAEQIKKADASYKSARNSLAIAKITGVKLDNDGNPDMSGLKPKFKDIIAGKYAEYTNDHEILAVKSKMVTYLQSAAQEGTFGALNFDREIKRAYDAAGGNFIEDTKEGGIINVEAYVTAMFKEGRVQAFFEQQASVRKEARNSAAMYLSQPENTPYVSKVGTNSLAYLYAPLNVIDEESPEYKTPQQFAKFSGTAGQHAAQAQMDVGFGPGKVKLPDQYLSKWDEEVAYADPVKVAERVASATQKSGVDYSSDPNVNAIFNKIRQNNVNNYAIRGAGKLPTGPMLTGGDPTKQTVDPSRAAPSTPIYVDSQGRISPVSSSSGVAASGATLPPGSEYHKRFSQSSGFADYDAFEKEALGAFGAAQAPKGYDQSYAQ